VIDCNEKRTEKRHECTSMGKVKRLELWWQLYRTSLPVWDLENFRPMDFCWHECTTFRGSVRVPATHSIRQFPLHFPSCASPWAIMFQTHYTNTQWNSLRVGQKKVYNRYLDLFPTLTRIDQMCILIWWTNYVWWNHSVSHAISNVILNGFIIHYHTFLHNYLYTNCMLVIRHPDDGHTCDRNMFVKNNMWLNTFVNVHFSIHHITTQNSLMPWRGTHEDQI